MERFDVVIVGGGFAGLVTAAALADGRRRIAILEARDAIQNRFSGELIHPSGVSVLGRLGLLDRLRETTGGATVNGFVVAIDGDGDAIIPYDRVLGFSCNHVAMVETMRPEVEKRGVTLRRGVRVREVLRSESGRVAGVRTEDGQEIHASLVVIADGRHSKMRNVVGLSAETELLSFTAAPLVSASVLPVQGHGHIFVGAWGPILAYPTEHGRARMCIDLPTDTDRATVRERIRTTHARFVPPRLRAALLHALEEDELEICATHRVFTRRCALPGVVMVGDAAGCCHPLTAAGMSVALHDAETLARQLDALDPAASTSAQGDRLFDLALLRYQEERYAFARAREHLTNALYEVFRGSDAPTRAVGLGLLRAWREDEELRRGSMALLAGLESRPGAFVGAYLRVAGRSTRGVLTGQFGEASLRGRTKALVGLAKLSARKVTQVLAT